MDTACPDVAVRRSDSCPSPKTTSSFDSTTRRRWAPPAMRPAMRDVPVAGDSQASRTNQASVRSTGRGRSTARPRSREIEAREPGQVGQDHSPSHDLEVSSFLCQACDPLGWCLPFFPPLRRARLGDRARGTSAGL